MSARALELLMATDNRARRFRGEESKFRMIFHCMQSDMILGARGGTHGGACGGLFEKKEMRRLRKEASDEVDAKCCPKLEN